jgi:hypothetical protein
MPPNTPPFGGIPYQPNNNLSPVQTAPPLGYRIIPGSVWWRLIYWPWRRYLASLITPPPRPSPPLLGPPKPTGPQGFHFTDRESLEGLVWPIDFATRLALPGPTHLECHQYGCAVVEFNPTQYLRPQWSRTQYFGLTPLGAREWVTALNVELDISMRVIYVDRDPRGGHRYYYLPL